MENIVGKQLGPYQVIEPLGEGGMAAVYKGFQSGIDRYVALKILPKRLADDPKFIGRFEQEAKIVAQLQHPHILPVYDYGESGGYAYIVMPYIQGGTLVDLLQNSPIRLSQTITIVSQIAGALDYAHNKLLIHRDIKPSNILIDESGNCLLTDFGIAKMFSSASHFTGTGRIIGTPDYMSPEQGQGKELDRRSDVYSLGIVLYEMVTGRVPFKAETPIATVMKHIYDPLPAPRNLNSALPESVELVIFRALAKDPEDRFPTAGDLAAALRINNGNVGMEPTALETPLFSGAAASNEARHDSPSNISRWLLIVLAIVLLVLACSGGTYIAITGLFGPSEETPTHTPSVTLTPTPATTLTSTPTLAASPSPAITVTPTNLAAPTIEPLIGPSGVAACTFVPMEPVTAGTNARLWTQPNVMSGVATHSLLPNVQMTIKDGPVWGRIRRDMEVLGWWWFVQSNGAEGWLWQGRINECDDQTVP